eukprot:TRINITY_DN22025_c0_g2_i1.p1 TRINITY_DN22025_c0_g2~~TRINITY_DN22025_c0_g2_i1.p1  ORF type:complete len:464 (-),score=57.41 TRINITY_DN22025_c0_g2_i1:166-1557(-)
MACSARVKKFSDFEFASVSLRGSKFDVPKHFTVLNVIGQGAYSVVCSAKEGGKKDNVAIKKIENPFEEPTFAVRALRELKIMRSLQHDNLLGLHSIFLSGSKSSFEDVYVVCELMETDLGTIIRSSQSLSADHCQFFQYQILRGVKYLHSANVMHRDLKPRNLLVNSDCGLKICDYGLARVQSPHEHPSALTEYVSTRWYRAPELLCSWVYDKSVDIWSAGCIFVELLTRETLFAGKTAQHQLQLIVQCLGTPKCAAVEKIANTECRKYIHSLSRTVGKSWSDVIKQPHADKLVLELVGRSLCFAASERATATEALQLKYFSTLHCSEDEPTRSPLSAAEFAFEMADEPDLTALREAIWLEAVRSPWRTSRKRPAEALAEPAREEAVSSPGRTSEKRPADAWAEASAEEPAREGEAATKCHPRAGGCDGMEHVEEAYAEALPEDAATRSVCPRSQLRSRLSRD